MKYKKSLLRSVLSTIRNSTEPKFNIPNDFAPHFMGNNFLENFMIFKKLQGCKFGSFEYRQFVLRMLFKNFRAPAFEMHSNYYRPDRTKNSNENHRNCSKAIHDGLCYIEYLRVNDIFTSRSFPLKNVQGLV